MSIFKVKAVCLLAALTLTFALLTGCSQSKDPVSTVAFESAAQQKGYIVQDGTDFFAAYDYVKLDYAYTYNIFTRGSGYYGDGYSVRCVKNGGEIIESSSSKKSASSDSKYEQNDWFSEF